MKKTPKTFVSLNPAATVLLCQDEWVIQNIEALQHELANVQWKPETTLVINGENIIKMDSAGAWLLTKWLTKNTADKHRFTLKNFSEQHQKLLSLIEEEKAAQTPIPKSKRPHWLATIGKSTLEQLSELQEFLAFTGMLAMESLRLVRHPGSFRFKALVSVLDSTGFRALPIIALLSFMIGVVIAYQMGNQLKSYGANLFIVDFLGLSILREFGPLLAAIMVAGRTGSAYTAQLGTMKINQEIDALNTMGVTPAELLIIPRVLGLFIAMPLLALWADVFGVLGGMMMAHTMLGIVPYDFLTRFSHVIPVKTLIIGLGKAPVFALLIATVGCFEGMRVSGSADSVGKQTTRSVVLGIFFIIVIDAAFSIILSKMKL